MCLCSESFSKAFNSKIAKAKPIKIVMNVATIELSKIDLFFIVLKINYSNAISIKEAPVSTEVPYSDYS